MTNDKCQMTNKNPIIIKKYLRLGFWTLFGFCYLDLEIRFNLWV